MANMDSHLLAYIPQLESSMKNSSISVRNVYLSSAPKGLDKEFNDLLTDDAIEFLIDLAVNFEDGVNNLYNNRLQSKSQLRKNLNIPKFAKSHYHNDDWQITPVNNRLKNRHLDLGDVSPSNLAHFTAALHANVQGIQVDFDDGHCPTWFNQIHGLHNVLKVVQNLLPNVPDISNLPILMMRPRAWNMIEHNMSVNGKEIPGPLFDFGLLIFHNGKKLYEQNCGPCFYLSKLESYHEARLWNDIFIWSEMRLQIPHGNIKACVLIENILSAFEMDQILYELRHHSLGLNCGIWDYAASIIAKFGGHKSYLLPDRNKYVNMNQRFLKKYMQLVVKICHRRGAHATGGMIAQVLSNDNNSQLNTNILRRISDAKISEIKNGIDGFIIYDIRLVEAMNYLWKQHEGLFENQINFLGIKEEIIEKDLLALPQGGVTINGLRHNISVTILFINNWLNGKGHFVYKGAVEDSATAEISRSQIWQWIQHGAKLEDNGEIITRQLVKYQTDIVLNDILHTESVNFEMRKSLDVAIDLFFYLINQRNFPDFITTFISNTYPFRKLHSHL
ncbi:hypothetical protein PV326_002681 [Microctonus aethiopoides]|nr:hypothetical protein PV326_002681 [Microctonus aethiopoides]